VINNPSLIGSTTHFYSAVCAMVSSATAGYLCALVAMVLAGSWQAAVKHESIRKHEVHPGVLNLYYAFGFFLASWSACAVEYSDAYSFTSWGLLGGFLFDCSMILNMAVSFPTLGVAVGSGIASSVVVLTSFIWSAAVFDQDLRSVSMACFGVVIVIIGLNTIIFTGRYFATTVVPGRLDRVIAAKGTQSSQQTEEASLLPAEKEQLEVKPDLAFLLAVLGAILAGIFGGSYLVPSMACCANIGIMFLPSMGIGCLISAPFLSAMTLLFVPENTSHPVIPTYEAFSETVVWGMLGGAVSSLAIIFIIKAINDIDYVVATTLAQCSIFITGLWGWIFLGEFKGSKAVSWFFAGAAVLVAGAMIVAHYGHK